MSHHGTGGTGESVLVFLDRDGTINEDRGHLYDPNDLRLLPNAANGLLSLQSQGALLVMVTNQSGVGRGLEELFVDRVPELRP